MAGSSSDRDENADKGGVRFWQAWKPASQDSSARELNATGPSVELGHTVSYRTYKRRWIGFVALILMNNIVSWDWLTFAPVADISATYYGVSVSAINWISTAFFLANLATSPLVIITLHRGPKLAFTVAAVLIIVGNWVRYAGSIRSSGGHYGAVMAGEILIGFAQPFVLAAPTSYSDMWFTTRGRVSATALTSLSNPFGGALGQLINPLWAKEASDVSRMVLYVSIISTIGALPAFIVPASPPTPVGPSSETPKLRLKESVKVLAGTLELWLVLIPFFVYVGFFNSLSSLLSQIMTPYGISNEDAGIGGAILIISGLVFSAIVSPILDRTKKFMLAIKVLIPIIGVGYLVFLWMPETGNLAGPYTLLAIIGAASFGVMPVALEFLAELAHPLGPAVTSTTAWAGGQMFGAIFVIISDALTADRDGSPPLNMKRALIFHAVIAMAVCPLPLLLGLFGRGDRVTLRRVRSDQRSGPLELQTVS